MARKWEKLLEELVVEGSFLSFEMPHWSSCHATLLARYSLTVLKGEMMKMSSSWADGPYTLTG